MLYFILLHIMFINFILMIISQAQIKFVLYTVHFLDSLINFSTFKIN